MTLLATRALGVTFAQPLFADLDLAIAPGDRIGLVAANGTGKSTLLALLAGEAEPTFGAITRARSCLVGHLRQDIPDRLLAEPLRKVVEGGLPPDLAAAEGWRTDLVLDEFAIPDDLRDRPLGALSGGWQRIAMLARVWIAGPDLLLMDEPTNHLDLSRIAWLEDWLAAQSRDLALVVASHDRAFLDAATERTLFLRPTASRFFALPYSPARAALDEADEADGRRYASEMKKADQLRRQAAKLKNVGINSGSDLLLTKTKQLKDRAERIEAEARPAARDRSAGRIRLDTAEARAKALVALDAAQVTAPDGRALYRTGKLWIGPGDRVALLGPNGAGKSRLMALVSDGGAGVTLAASARPGRIDQALSEIRPEETPFAALSTRSDTPDQALKGLLAGAGIAAEMQARPVARLSGGQRARLALLLLRLTRPNLYLLDEPTNHLDIAGQEALEAELAQPGTSALIVSHDRAFVRGAANRFWVIEGRRLVEHGDPEAFFAAAR